MLFPSLPVDHIIYIFVFYGLRDMFFFLDYPYNLEWNTFSVILCAGLLPLILHMFIVVCTYFTFSYFSLTVLKVS